MCGSFRPYLWSIRHADGIPRCGPRLFLDFLRGIQRPCSRLRNKFGPNAGDPIPPDTRLITLLSDGSPWYGMVSYQNLHQASFDQLLELVKPLNNPAVPGRWQPLWVGTTRVPASVA